MNEKKNAKISRDQVYLAILSMEQIPGFEEFAEMSRRVLSENAKFPQEATAMRHMYKDILETCEENMKLAQFKSFLEQIGENPTTHMAAHANRIGNIVSRGKIRNAGEFRSILAEVDLLIQQSAATKTDEIDAKIGQLNMMLTAFEQNRARIRRSQRR